MKVGSLHTIGRAWIALLLLTLAAALTTRMPVSGAASHLEASRTDAPGSALGVILGQVRTTMAAALWLKADAYLHRGVRYSLHPHHEGGACHDHDHHGETSTHHVPFHLGCPGEASGAEVETHQEVIIPRRGHDFRGVLGDLEREIKPFALGHVLHGEEEELLPWFRMVTALDPHNVRAYKVGAFWLYDRPSDRSVEEGLAFIEEGLRHNRRSPDLFYARGHAYFLLKEYERAVLDFAQALDLVEAAGGFENDSQEQDMLFASRYLVYAHQRLSEPQKAIEACERGLRLFPDDEPLRALHEQIGAALAASAL